MQSTDTAALTEFCGRRPNHGVENDIVFVHGLNGHSLQTWTSSNPSNPDNLPWPGLFLPTDLEWTPSRILTFSYDARVWDSSQTESQGTVREHAQRLMEYLDEARTSCTRRPLLFVAHSLGGIIVKEMLMMAETYAGYSSIVSCTRAILFFGTPHCGSPDAVKGGFPATMLRVLGLKVNAKWVRQLRPSGDLIQSLEQDFPLWLRKREGMNHRIDICCFFEMKPMSVLNVTRRQLVVDRRSATMDGLKAIGIDSDHSGMVKFATRQGDYRLFLHELRRSLPISRTAVYRVVWQDNAEAMKTLLESSFDINNTSLDSHGPAACMAATFGKLEVFKVLAEDGKVEIDRPDDEFGRTPLFCAAQGGLKGSRHLDIMQVLLDNPRIKLDARDKDDQTPLIAAIKVGCLDAANLLLDHGANWTIADRDGDSYHWAEISLGRAIENGDEPLAGQYRAIMEMLRGRSNSFSSRCDETNPERLERSRDGFLAITRG